MYTATRISHGRQVSVEVPELEYNPMLAVELSGLEEEDQFLIENGFKTDPV